MNKIKLLRIKDFITPKDLKNNKKEHLQSSYRTELSSFPLPKNNRPVSLYSLHFREPVFYNQKILALFFFKTKTLQIEDLYLLTFANFYQLSKKVHFSKATYKWNSIVPNVFLYSTYKTSYTIVRPLMSCLRNTITMTCVLNFLPVYPDRSNLKTEYSRNRIRKQIIPTIKFFLNPKMEKALFQFSEFYNKEISLSFS